MFSTFMLSFLHFNPRPREEGDYMMFRNASFGNNFNPRPREEGDLQHTAHAL